MFARKLSLYAAALLLASAFGTPAEVDASVTAEATPLIIGQSYTLESKILGETRRYNVMLPPGYAEGGVRYPVLLLLDGGLQEDFHHLSGIVQISVANGTMRPVILVGIENTERRRDLTGPTEVAEDRKIAPKVGGSAPFRRFLADELLPRIRADYRTSPETAIAGESLAGLFIMETLLLAPELFDSYIAVSPSLWWNQEYLARNAAVLLKAHAPHGKTVFLSVANEENMQKPVAEVARVLEAQGESRVRLHYETMPTETHASVFHGAALKAFRRLLAPLPQAAAKH